MAAGRSAICGSSRKPRMPTERTRGREGRQHSPKACPGDARHHRQSAQQTMHSARAGGAAYHHRPHCAGPQQAQAAVARPSIPPFLQSDSAVGLPSDPQRAWSNRAPTAVGGCPRRGCPRAAAGGPLPRPIPRAAAAAARAGRPRRSASRALAVAASRPSDHRPHFL
eukprot:scaffold3579_cov30-Tisochrysis_lutea.AAC.3